MVACTTRASTCLQGMTSAAKYAKLYSMLYVTFASLSPPTLYQLLLCINTNNSKFIMMVACTKRASTCLIKRGQEKVIIFRFVVVVIVLMNHSLNDDSYIETIQVM